MTKRLIYGIICQRDRVAPDKCRSLTAFPLSGNLRSGATKSCGCHKRQTNGKCSITHGKTQTVLYKKWHEMKKRCNNKNCKDFPNYGERGIRVCEEWEHNFQAFYDWSISSGYEDGLTIDRLNVDGNYSPDNCRWATKKEQNNNKRTNHYETYNSETLTLAQFAEKYGISYHKLRNRIRHGWTIEKAIETP